MEAILFLIAAVVLLLPLALSIAALVRASEAKAQAGRLQRELESLRSGPGTPAPVRHASGAPRTMPSSATVSSPAPPPALAPEVASRPEDAPAKTPSRARPRRTSGTGSRGTDLEVALGGKLAAFVGIAALVLGVAFFVGYAIKHGWIGPGMRIVLGLLTGGALIAVGHASETRGRNLHVLARVLTGGGAALLFFSVYAAHGFYRLIPAWAAAAGLFSTALAVLGLSVVYRSQTVALLGVIGAFVTPLVLGGDLDRGAFPLAYIAAVNAVVMTLGLRRNWQSLYNVAFVFTALYTFAWLSREMRDSAASSWPLALGFCLVYFAEYTVLGLVKLKSGPEGRDRRLDLLRMLATSLLLLGAMHRILDASGRDAWIGASFLAAAAAHVAIARAAWRWLPRFGDEILVLLAGGITFATLALPVQLDGVWVSLGWALEALVLSAFGLRYRVGAFRSAGILLGVVGLAKALLYDPASMAAPGNLFLNGRFLVSLISTVLLGVQARLYARDDVAGRAGPSSADVLLIVASVGFVLAIAVDGIVVLRAGDPWAWMPAVLALPAAAAFLLIEGTRRRSNPVRDFASVLLALVPVALFQFVFGLAWSTYDTESVRFFNVIFLGAATAIAATLWLTFRFPTRGDIAFPREAVLTILCVAAGVFVVSREIGRAETPWKDSAITLWWGACALALTFLGLRVRKRYLRHAALALFGITVGKVFVVDLAGLGGLIRVAAFVGVGLILLVVSFTYQRIAPRLADTPPDAPKPEAGAAAASAANED